MMMVYFVTNPFLAVRTNLVLSCATLLGYPGNLNMKTTQHPKGEGKKGEKSHRLGAFRQALSSLSGLSIIQNSNKIEVSSEKMPKEGKIVAKCISQSLFHSLLA